MSIHFTRRGQRNERHKRIPVLRSGRHRTVLCGALGYAGGVVCMADSTVRRYKMKGAAIILLLVSAGFLAANHPLVAVIIGVIGGGWLGYEMGETHD